MGVAPTARRFTATAVAAWAGLLVACLDEPSGRLVGPEPSAAALSTAVSGAPWAKIYGGPLELGGAQVVRQTPDGALLVAGWTQSFGAGLNDFWVLKLDGSGAPLWQKAYGGGGDEAVENIEITPDGGAIIVGLTTSFGAAHEPWVLKIDAQGNVQWEHTYRTTGRDWGFSIQPTRDGGYILAGGTDLGWPTSCCREDGQLIKLASDGAIEWQTTFGTLNSENFRSVQQTADGGFIVAGYTGPHGLPHNDGWLLKLDVTGSIEWQKTFGGNAQEELYGVAQTADGGYVLAGRTTSFGAGAGDAWVLRLTSAGSVLWAKAFGGASGEEGAFDVQPTSDGGFVVAGWTGSFAATGLDTWILKLDGNGTIVWQKVYDSGAEEDIGRSIREIPGSGYVAASGGSPAASRFTVLRLDQNGTIASTCPVSMGATTSGVPTSVSEPAPGSSGTSATSTALATARNAVSTNTSVTVQTVCAAPDNPFPTAVARWTIVEGTGGYIKFEERDTKFPPRVLLDGSDSRDGEGNPFTSFTWSWLDNDGALRTITRNSPTLEVNLPPGERPVTLLAGGAQGTAQTTIDVRVPDLVLLVHGFFGSQASFGQLGPLLVAGGYTAMAFDYSALTNCSAEARQTGISALADRFQVFVEGTVLGHGGQGYRGHTSVVAHSMGGLVTRAYMIRPTYPAAFFKRLITAGTPSYGSNVASFAWLSTVVPDLGCNFSATDFKRALSLLQVRQMEPGSEFLWQVHRRWSTNPPLVADHYLTIAGVIGSLFPGDPVAAEGDKVVRAYSATLPPLSQTRIAYASCAHVAVDALCGIVDVPVGGAGSNHSLYQIAKPFLEDIPGTEIPGPVPSAYQVPPFQLSSGLLVLRLESSGRAVAPCSNLGKNQIDKANAACNPILLVNLRTHEQSLCAAVLEGYGSIDCRFNDEGGIVVENLLPDAYTVRIIQEYKKLPTPVGTSLPFIIAAGRPTTQLCVLGQAPTCGAIANEADQTLSASE